MMVSSGWLPTDVALHCVARRCCVLEYSLEQRTPRLESIHGAMTVEICLYTCWKKRGGHVSAHKTSFTVALQVDSSSPCDSLLPLERAEATTSLACAGTRDTLARWWSAIDIEVSCKAVRVFLLVRKLVDVWMRYELRTRWSRVAGCQPTCIALPCVAPRCCVLEYSLEQRTRSLESIRGAMTVEICL